MKQQPSSFEGEEKIVFETPERIVRVRVGKTKLVVKVHQKVAGVEHLPRGYLLGLNFLECDL
jgi:hypothetical protein